MVHMAAYPHADGDWSSVSKPNIIGTYNALEAARRKEHDPFVILSTNHVMGEYETEHVPELYSPRYDLVLNHTDPAGPIPSTVHRRVSART